MCQLSALSYFRYNLRRDESGNAIRNYPDLVTDKLIIYLSDNRAFSFAERSGSSCEFPIGLNQCKYKNNILIVQYFLDYFKVLWADCVLHTSDAGNK